MEPTFGARVRAARKQLGLSQMAAASRVGINSALLGTIERGQEPTERSKELIQKNLLSPANMLQGKLRKKESEKKAAAVLDTSPSDDSKTFLVSIMRLLGSTSSRSDLLNMLYSAQRLGFTLEKLVSMVKAYEHP